MSEDSEKGFDLDKAIAPIELETPSLGRVAIDVRTVGFLKWFENESTKSRWSDGASFVRALLLDRTCVAGLDTPIDAAVIAGLDRTEIEEAANSLLTATKTLFRRRGAEQPAPANEKCENVEAGASERLLRSATSYHDEYRERLAQSLARFRSASQPFGGLSMNMPNMFSAADRIRSAMESIQSNSLSKMLEEARRPALFTAMQQLSRPVFIDHFRDATRSINTPSAIFSLGDEHNALIKRMQKRDDPLRRIRELVDKQTAGLRLAELRAAQGLFADRALWASEINRRFDLNVGKSVLASVAAFQAGILGPASAADMLASAKLFRPGFRTAAMLGLDGLAAEGAVADVLRFYDAERSIAEAFTAVRDSVVEVDRLDGSPDQFLRAVERAWTLLIALFNGAKGVIEKQGLFSTIALLVAVATYMQDSEMLALAEDSPSRRDFTAMIEELQGMRADSAAREVHEQAERRHLRYLHEPTNLRAGPDRASIVIRIAYPDQWVRVLDTKGNWARVEVFDYKSDAPIEGWFVRRNLRQRPL